MKENDLHSKFQRELREGIIDYINRKSMDKCGVWYVR